MGLGESSLLFDNPKHFPSPPRAYGDIDHPGEGVGISRLACRASADILAPSVGELKSHLAASYASLFSFSFSLSWSVY